ncbi:uncharacterized protein LOC133204910 [Saccostrea echinata]|uniref:uncharacterized protein LOC133204910 n=1 Tax=Saccostrea echinata TaxID=191078 RepID=UPI002A83D292|nr:uncharacterized protein LOC133204910 [Saccostrea echinata]
MASLLVLFLLHAVLCFADAAQNFQEVSVCPRNADTWKIESDKKNCKGDTPDYLCAAIENNVNRYGEICTKYGLSPANKCAVLNNQTHNLDSVDCKAASGCPAVPYNPSELWKYPICYANFYGRTRAPPTTTTVQTTAPPVSGPEESGGSGAGAAVGVVVALLIIVLVVVVVLVVFYRRNQFGFKDKMGPLFDNIRNRLPGNRDGETRHPGNTDEETGKTEEKETLLQKEEIKIRKLNILQKYLVHILKKEIDVKDLKEKTIIHFKSLKEHFTEPLLQNLYSVEKADDYNKLDMSLVFALLRNFCVNIKPSKRGWDYEPPDDERTIGADIERIRFMWNKYCDNNYEFKNLDDVFNRIKQTYGTVAVQDEQNKTVDESEGFSEIKEKIQSIKLHPDCSVEKGTVITEGIKLALQSLETGNIVICKGAIGCGKTYTLKAIQNRYKEKGWKVRWMEEHLFIQEESMEDKTIVICDNLFGSYGCNIFSSKGISDTEILLEKMQEKSWNIKVAVGIHQHVFDEVKRIANLKLLQNKNITVDLDKLTRSEMLLILKEQQKEGHCKTDSSCWFKGVDLTLMIDKLSQNQGHIGSPFLSFMYCHQHDFFSEEAFTKNPLQSLTQHFQKMRDGSSSTEYYGLVYLMCVRKHKDDDELTSWAGSLEANLTRNTLQNIATKMSGFFRVENGVTTISHEVLTIALFRATSYVETVFLPVIQNCEIEILLQLMRPSESSNTEFSCGFPNPEKNTQNRNICKFIVKRFADAFKSDWGSMEHPLKHHTLFEEKFSRYVTSKPKVK